MKNLKLWLGVVGIVILFLLAAYFSQTYSEEIKILLATVPTAVGMVTYVLINIVAVVLAPLVTLPLLPIVAASWGSLVAGLLTIIGWTTGSMVAFVLARRYGRPLVQKLASPDILNKIEEYVPESDRGVFWTIVFLRMAIPVDELSYALGLFSKIRLRTYSWATLIGVAPGALIFAYVGTMPLRIQVGTFIVGGIVVFAMLRYAVIRKRRAQNLGVQHR